MNKLYIKHLKLNTINYKKILTKHEHKKIVEKIILSNKGYYIFINNKLFNIKLSIETLDETDDTIIIKEKTKKNQVWQIPINNKPIIKIKYEINYQGNILVFEIFDDLLYDFYILTKKDNLDNYFLNKEISYIKKMLI